jgi:hypothetical protein
VQAMRAWRYLIWLTRGMCQIIISMELVVSVGEDGQFALGDACSKSRLALDSMRWTIETRLESQVDLLTFNTTCTFGTIAAAAAGVLFFWLGLRSGLFVFLAPAVALCMVAFVLASRATMFTLLDRTAFFGNQKYFSLSMVARADSVAANARVASPFLSISDHSLILSWAYEVLNRSYVRDFSGCKTKLTVPYISNPGNRTDGLRRS